MLDQYRFHEMTITWLEGADLYVDGGRIFGPVPKAVWKRFTPYNKNNQVPNASDPILIQYQGKNYLIDASTGISKMSAKAKRNAGIQSDNRMLESLASLSLTASDIDVVLLTHAHDDHMGGLSYKKDGKLFPTFPEATVYIQEDDWVDVQNPTGRTKGTYLRENWEPIAAQVQTFRKELEVAPGLRMVHTGGHTRGMSIVELKQEDERILHMGDNFASTYHANPNWVMAIDDYPLEVITIREKWLFEAFEKHTMFIYYHDPYIRLAKFDETGEQIVYGLMRSKAIGMRPTEEQDKMKHPLKAETSTFKGCL